MGSEGRELTGPEGLGMGCETSLRHLAGELMDIEQHSGQAMVALFGFDVLLGFFYYYC